MNFSPHTILYLLKDMNYEFVSISYAFNEEVNITFMKTRLVFVVDIQSFSSMITKMFRITFCNNSAESLANLKLPKANIIFLP